MAIDFQKIADGARISIDEVRARWLVLRSAYWKADFRRFAREAIKIRTKAGDLEPLVLNQAQEILLAKAEEQLAVERWVRLAGLKGRRQGFSTMVAARGYWRATLWDRQNIYILSHDFTSSTKLFDMVDLMQQKHPFPPQVGTDNAKELDFPKRGSSYTVATAGKKAGGRGGGISFFHGSEVAWWENAEDHFSASVQAVDEVRGQWGVLWTRPEKPLPFEAAAPPVIEGWIKPPSEIWLETTSAGPLGVFFKRYMEAMKGIGRYVAAFVPWTVQPEYTERGDFTASVEPDEEGELSEAEYQELHDLADERMLWRRSKIQELGSPAKFRQEYPMDVTEAFSSADIEGVFIKPAFILKARKRTIPMPDAPLVIGVDPAGGGGDRFAVAWRRGDLIYRVKARYAVEHDEAVAWLSSIIREDRPNRMNVDRGSMGANILSSLKAIGPDISDVVRGIDFGGKSKAKLAHPHRAGPWNRRAEMYGRFLEWLKEGGSIPDDDDLASDMAAPKMKWRANNDWLLESKSDMKARGLRSNDNSDACALTFASNEFFDTWSRPAPITGFGAGQAQLRPVAAPGVGDFGRFYEASLPRDTGWMA